MNQEYNIITILGPTASGKTTLAVELAYQLKSEIISADSRQVYKGMDIGTGKDLSEYTISDTQIPHHLIDIVNPGYKYNLFEYQRDFLKAYELIQSKGVTPILCGGTGLYLESVLKGYQLLPVPENRELRSTLETYSLEELTKLLATYKELHNTTDVDNKKRAIRAIEIEEYYKSNPCEKRSFPHLKSIIFGVDISRDRRRKRISHRLHQRLEEGMLDEVKGLLAQGVSPEDLIYYGLEYKFLTQHLIGELSYQEMVSKLEIAIHQFAKRQMTWFRGMERRGFKIHWISEELNNQEKVSEIIKLIKE